MLDLRTLNPPQREAVVHGEGPLLVLAGAGSGKTRVLTCRVAHLVGRGMPARSICALSFTNKAAAEMKERVAKLVGKHDAEELTMSTFHSLGLAILKQEQAALGHPRGFTIYDGADQLGVVREVLRDVKVDDRRFDPKAILHRISRAKNAFIGPEEYAGGAPIRLRRSGGAEGHEAPSIDDYDQVTKVVYPRYQRALRAFAAVDFDDLIALPVRLFDRDERVRDRWQGRFHWLLVDEYQDTNRAQLMMVARLAVRHSNVTVVGDDDQSIYAWRGAEASNILEFEKHFPGARIVKLEQNYRSTPVILSAANAVIANNAARHEKKLWSDRPGGDRIQAIACADSDDEAKFVCDELERLRLEDRRRYQDCAILYRSNVQARAFEEALRSRRIPYVMHGGQQFYERKEIKDVIAYLKLALSERDEISLRRIVNYPARGIGAATIDRLAQHALAARVPLLVAMRRAAEIPGVTAQARAAVAEFVALVDRIAANLERGGLHAARELVEDVRLYDDLRAAAPTALAAQRRVDNVIDFLRSLEEHEKKSPGREALSSWLHVLSLNANDDDDAEHPGDKVTMTTLHGAKGLEWPVVFLVGMEEELLPHARTLYPQGPDVEGESDVSEERRLAYVGITRARERLYMTRARTRKKHGKDRMRTVSRFLEEIPDALLDRHDRVSDAAAPVDKAELAGFFSSFLSK
jgi:DNA helicase-2/ATP-dependent DNA helicase PcrA